MINALRQSCRITALCAATALVAACSSSDDHEGMSHVRLAVTDAPVDELEEVRVSFTCVIFQGQSDDNNDENGPPSGNGGPGNAPGNASADCESHGNRIAFPLDLDEPIDLLELQNGNTALLIDEPIPAGTYQWIRLVMDDENGNSYVVDVEGGEHPLTIPGGQQAGVQLNGPFTLEAGLGANFVVDFDLRRAIINPPGQDGYMMRRVARIVEVEEAGGIVGTIEPTLMTADHCTADAATGSGAAVYVYEGHDATAGDLGSDDEPTATASVNVHEETGDYVFFAAFLPAGEYTVAFTCQAADDDPEAADDDILIEPQLNVEVNEGALASVEFTAPSNGDDNGNDNGGENDE